MHSSLTPAACRAARALLKWSTRDLARESGVAFTTINRIEAGAEPRAATAQKIQAAFARFGVRLVAPPETGAVLGTAPSGPPPQEAAERLLDLTIRLFRASRAADREEIGLGGLQLSTMTTIQLNSGISLTALAGAERVAHPTMSRLIGSLIRAGMVEKSPDPADRRVQRLRLTQAGEAAWRSARARRARDIETLVQRLGPATSTHVVTALAALVGELSGRESDARRPFGDMV